MLNHGLEWGRWVLNELMYTSDSGLTDTYSTLADGRSRGLHCRSFGHAPVELSTRYTTADIVSEIGSTRATVE